MKCLAVLPLLLVATLAAQATGRPQNSQAEPLAPRAVRNALLGAASDLSRVSQPGEVELLREVMERLGESPEKLDRIAPTWERNLRKDTRSASRVARVVKVLRRQARDLGGELEQLEGDRQRELAELILMLDALEPRANETLGRELHEGRWLTPQELTGELGAARVADLARAARALEIEVTSGVSDSVVLAKLYAQECVVVSSHGVALHSPLPAPKLERMLRQVLRAATLSNALLEGELEVPEKLQPHVWILLDSERAYDDALKEAHASGGVTDDVLREHGRLKIGAFWDDRGWQVMRWGPEAQSEAKMLWWLLVDWFGHDAQACLLAGHLNWLCLNVLGTSMPLVLRREEAQADSDRTSTLGERVFAAESLWRAARQSIYGCRAWMIREVQEGTDPSWTSSMVSQVGKIRSEALLKTTLVTAFLQERGRLLELLEATRSERDDRVALFEEALGYRIPELEAAWARWLLRRPAREGLAQTLEGPAEPTQLDERHATLLAALNALRARALAEQSPEVERVMEDPELSDGAQAHARYLARNQEQMEAWPDAHEEYPDVEEFSVLGARAGLRSVIYPFTPPLEALDGWMGTFYHRLPLLEPGLFGVGIGIEPEATVLVTGSLVLAPWRPHWLVWPPAGEPDVPLAFVPELPNPVPGKDQSKFGYPITLQVQRPLAEDPLELVLALHQGDADGPEVDCYRLSPTEFFFAEAVPNDAWCLIPKRHLRAQTKYTLTVQQTGDRTRQWSFRTGTR